LATPFFLSLVVLSYVKKSSAKRLGMK
jgi:hypothetical protein